MSEHFTITVDNEDHVLTEQNHTVALFHDEPEYDYIHLQPEKEDDEEQRHILIFRHQYLCHWIGGLALNPSDQAALDEMNTQLGYFKDLYGFRSRKLIEDNANDFEKEFYTEGLLGDLKQADAPPEDW